MVRFKQLSFWGMIHETQVRDYYQVGPYLIQLYHEVKSLYKWPYLNG